MAPAPLPVLAGVVVLVTFLLAAVSFEISNDWLAVFAAFAVLALGAVVLDYRGRHEAQRHPHDLYRPQRLPHEKSPLRSIFILGVLVALVIVVIATARPGRASSPFPYFVAVELLAFVMPQLLARRIVRRHR